MPVDLERLEQLFHRALALPASERRDHVATWAAGDAELLAELGELLDAHDGAPGYLEQPAWTAERLVAGENGVEPGTRLGPYLFQRLLGEGGMGAVFLAEQQEPLRREVAVKLIKPGMDTREVLARFEAERQLLARLQHPHIAAVHDAGSTPRGRPFFVMEYVDGERLTDAADQRGMGIVERLELLALVCDAVHHAHCRGVIHRDLTPGNVLVRFEGGLPVPKIIDFGVAKAVDPGGRPGTLCTRGGQLIGTPGYMSPEQAAHDGQVDTRTDVYSLGVMLQELLIGLLPADRADLAAAHADERLRDVMHGRGAVRPSERLQSVPDTRRQRLARRRGLDGRQLVRRLQGDLDWIVLKALAADPAERYASAAALAADLRRHLRHEPVSAGPPAVGYRVAKLVRAHRRAAAGSLVGLLAGLAVVAAWSWQQGVEHGEERVDAARGSESSVRTLEAPGVPSTTSVAACPDCVAPPHDVVTVRNGGDTTLSVGDVVELRASAPLVVGPAVAGSGHAALGPVAGQLVVEDGHRHLVEAGVPPDAQAQVVVRGTLAWVRVLGPVGVDQLLAVSERAGLARAARHGEAALGHALQASDGRGPRSVLAFIAPIRPTAGGDDLLAAAGVAAPPGRPPLLSDAGPLGPAGRGSDAGPVPGVPESGGGGVGAEGGGHHLTGLGMAHRLAPTPTVLLAQAGSPGLGQAPDDTLELDPRLKDGGAMGGDSKKGQLQGDGSTTASGTHAVTAEQSWDDVDQDGLPDLLSTTPDGTRLLQNLGQGVFEDVTRSSGLDPSRRLHAARWADLDGDGDHDLIALDDEGRVVMHQALGPLRFTDHALAAGLSELKAVQELVLVQDDVLPPSLSLLLGDGSLVLMLNDGSGRFRRQVLREAPEPPPATESATGATAGDGDGGAEDDDAPPGSLLDGGDDGGRGGSGLGGG